MGRKKVPSHQKKIQCSVSLQQSTVETIDSYTTRRSAWIEHAIKLKLEDVSAFDDLTLKDILNHALRMTHAKHMSFEERAVIQLIYHRLVSE